MSNKFKFVGETPNGPVNAYGVQKVNNGDIVELSDHLAGKARNNPNYQQVGADAKVTPSRKRTPAKKKAARKKAASK